jgi:hypothetical protein
MQRGSERLAGLIVLLGLLAGPGDVAHGQANFTVQARVFQALSITNTRALAFQSVFPGVNKTIPVTATTSGRYRVNGEANANISLTFTLPTDLVRNTGGNLLAIGSWTGIHNAINNATAGVTFTPSAAATPAQLSNIGRRFVFIGATVVPAPNQRQGTYRAVATLTVAYL